MYRVLIIEPSEIIQAGIRSALDFGRKFEVVGCYSDIQRIEEHIATLRANIIILNTNVLEFHRRSQVRSLFSENMIIIALSLGYMDNSIIEQFDGIIDLFEPICRIESRLIDAVSKNESNDNQNTSNEQNDLSDREKEILIEILKGLTNKEIAQHYNLSIHTVISHRKNITRKTGIKSVSGLTVYALLNNLIEQSDISDQ